VGEGVGVVNVYIWEDLDELTTNWHSDGGLVVVADDLEMARHLMRNKGEGWWPLPDGCEAFNKDPDRTIPCADTEPVAVFVFPNAGCC
jgi:hypothetical protein